MPEKTLLVSETFVSLQGEGISQGAPAGFLRLGRCNLACSFCDTPYTWDFERYSFELETRAVPEEELVTWVEQACPGRLIVTGGEPMIQQKQLLSLLERLVGRSELPVVEVETNGTILPLPALARLVNQWNVSPKLASSGEAPERRLKNGPLAWFSRQENAFFKFVIVRESDVREATELSSNLGVPSARVLFMPEARSAADLSARSGSVAAWALRERVRFSSRLHLELFGGKRGT